MPNIFPTPPYTRKYSIGETVENSKSGEVLLIIGSYKQLIQYVNNIYSSFWDEQNGIHTIYFVYNLNENNFSWIEEKKALSYCTNIERGKNILRSIFEKICYNGEFTVKEERKQDFYDEFFAYTPPMVMGITATPNA